MTDNLTRDERAALTKARLEAKKAAKAAKNAEALSKVINVIQTLREVSPNMSLNQALVFLEVAKGCQGEPGRVENLEVRRRTGIEASTLAKLTAVLSEKGRGGSKLELIDLSESEEDGRAKFLYLTDKGEILIKKIIDKIM